MSDIEQIELTIEEAKKLVARKDWANKLASNREFKKLVLEGYFEQEAARLVSLAGDANLIEQREEIFDAIKGISHFRQYLQNTVQMGRMAENEIVECEQELDALREEEAEELA